MTKAEFINKLAETLMVSPEELGPEVELSKFEAWDSTAVLQLVVHYEDHGVKVEEEKIPECKTVKDLLDLGGGFS